MDLCLDLSPLPSGLFVWAGSLQLGRMSSAMRGAAGGSVETLAMAWSLCPPSTRHHHPPCILILFCLCLSFWLVLSIPLFLLSWFQFLSLFLTPIMVHDSPYFSCASPHRKRKRELLGVLGGWVCGDGIWCGCREEVAGLVVVDGVREGGGCARAVLCPGFHVGPIEVQNPWNWVPCGLPGHHTP